MTTTHKPGPKKHEVRITTTSATNFVIICSCSPDRTIGSVVASVVKLDRLAEIADAHIEAVERA